MSEKKPEKPRKGWKDHLLRSGVPLEYQVASILSKEGMSVDADFSFMRRDVAGMKEWSVDIAARWYAQTRKKDDILFELQLLVECKFRSNEKFVLLLEDPNEQHSPVTLGGTVNSFDAFVPYKFPMNAFVPLESSIPYVYKGVELHEGGAVEEDIRHGIQQLRYATPVLLRQAFDFTMYSHPTDMFGQFFTKILVTNAPLFLLKRSVDIETIRAADDIKEISSAIDFAIFYSDYGPDFEDHFRSVFKEEAQDRIAIARSVRDRLQIHGKEISFHDDPVRLVENLSNASRYECRAVGTQFFLTTLDGLPRLLQPLKNACKQSYRDRKKPKKKSRKITKEN